MLFLQARSETQPRANPNENPCSENLARYFTGEEADRPALGR